MILGSAIFIIVIIALILCNALPIGLVDMVPFIKPKIKFSSSGLFETDYHKKKNWFICENETDDSLMDLDDHPADVFFVHRTTFLKRYSWNDSIRHGLQNLNTYLFSVRVQAKIFSGIARVFAPKYRQATLYSFYDTEDNGMRALDLAYEDVKNAFLYYLHHYNDGRPIILAGHSQGTYHLQRLIHEFFDNDENLRSRLICAYLVAMPVSRNSFEHIHPSCSPSETGCFVSWSTFGINAYPLYFKGQYDDALCTNPVSWQNDSNTPTDKKLHKGSTTFFLNRKQSKKITAYCGHGVLHINNPGLGYFRLRNKDYVTMDYHIFFNDIKENARERLKNYYKIRYEQEILHRYRVNVS